MYISIYCTCNKCNKKKLPKCRRTTNDYFLHYIIVKVIDNENLYIFVISNKVSASDSLRDPWSRLFAGIVRAPRPNLGTRHNFQRTEFFIFQYLGD